MDLLVEIILELVLEGSVEGATNNKLPKWARIGLLVLATLVYFAIMVVFIWLIVEADNVPARVILGIVVMFCIVAFVDLWYKVLKERKRKKDEMD